MKQYSVNKVSKMSGVSVRTLHHYDKIGLLAPALRTEAGYRQYGKEELLRLQQILFYKELGFPLKEITEILDNPDFDILVALKGHRRFLKTKIDRMDHLLATIDKTIVKLKNDDVMEHPEELYQGLNTNTAKAYREEAIEKYGDEMVKKAEKELMKMGKTGYTELKTGFEACNTKLFAMKDLDPHSKKVQDQIMEHYGYIRKFWGTANLADKQAEAYAGLGQLYVDDGRFTVVDGKPQPKFAAFLCDAMAHFAIHRLKH